jgi:hypothetical protein
VCRQGQHVLGDQQQLIGSQLELHLLAEFTNDGGRRGLAELDLPAGQVPAVQPVGGAQQDPVAVEMVVETN